MGYQEIAGVRLPFSDMTSQLALRAGRTSMLDLDRAARHRCRTPWSEVSFHGVTTDSRQVARGDLFVTARAFLTDTPSSIRR